MEINELQERVIELTEIVAFAEDPDEDARAKNRADLNAAETELRARRLAVYRGTK